jgi:hypothetical protein
MSEGGQEVGLLKRVFGRSDPPDGQLQVKVRVSPGLGRNHETLAQMFQEATDQKVRLVEIDIVGESFCQKELERIAGPKEPDGKSHRCGVTLRCEPDNKYDENAVRVEVMGLRVGHVARTTAAVLSPAMLVHSGGVIEANALIVGGWDDGDSQGTYGIRVWLTTTDLARISVNPKDVRRRRAPEEEDE